MDGGRPRALAPAQGALRPDCEHRQGRGQHCRAAVPAGADQRACRRVFLAMCTHIRGVFNDVHLCQRIIDCPVLVDLCVPGVFLMMRTYIQTCDWGERQRAPLIRAAVPAWADQRACRRVTPIAYRSTIQYGSVFPVLVLGERVRLLQDVLRRAEAS